ncbi:MAG TPA: serine/threonine-protein kinase [Solirubrobacteraceae bacterium]
MITIGQRFAGYELLEPVGDGETGAIYRARDIRLNRIVALRILAPDLARDPVTRARLNRESTALAAVDHANVLPIYEAGEHDGRIFIASRWVDGRTLSEMVREGGPLHPRRAVRIANQIAAALQATHALGIIHRNVKPSKVLVTPDADHVYLTDFGLARHSEDLAGLTVQHHLLETLDYVAPEYIRGAAIDARVDIYGLGCLLYESLTGEVPYPRDGAAAKMYAHQSAPPPSPRAANPEVPELLDAVVKRALAKDPEDRQQTPGEFAFEAASAVELSAPLWATRALAGLAKPAPDTAARSNRAAEQRDRRAVASADGHQDGEVIASPGEQRDQYPVAADVARDGGAGEFYEPKYYLRRGRRARRMLLWALAIIAFVAAPAALLAALLH